jgi:hypothetical protein
MGKIMGKSHELPRVTGGNAENRCGAGTSEDFLLEK